MTSAAAEKRVVGGWNEERQQICKGGLGDGVDNHYTAKRA
jgi:hypothetical protein